MKNDTSAKSLKPESMPFIIDAGVIIVLIYAITQVQELAVAYPKLIQTGFLAIATYFLAEMIGDVWEWTR